MITPNNPPAVEVVTVPTDAQSLEEVLEPCPFCRGPATVIAIRDGKTTQCQTCFAEGPDVFHGPYGWGATITMAIAAWNRRPATLIEHVSTPVEDRWQPIETAPQPIQSEVT